MIKVKYLLVKLWQALKKIKLLNKVFNRRLVNFMNKVNGYQEIGDVLSNEANLNFKRLIINLRNKKL